MVINVYGPGRKVLHQAETLAELETWLLANRNIASLERDKDYPNCADAIGYDGSVYCIQPADFQL